MLLRTRPTDKSRSLREETLFKKANELIVLCDARVSIIMISSTGKIHEFISPSTSQKMGECLNDASIEDLRGLEQEMALLLSFILDIEQLLMEAHHRESIHVIEEKASANIGLCFLQLIFPWHIDSNEDNLWEANCREKNEEIAISGMKFLNCCNFLNCELRSGVLVDRCILGSDCSTTNYPGKIPSGPDLPSDVANEKLSNDGAGK
ncbi:hypothetical protein F3Y22_tig00004072pilonHSYRG00349 [Hibiscus syriacus]|uniref:MADS-box domain-containing protein n=1 Tax=Hibiscus syriacus TaxID=106335 RepID=A0A6A3CNN6_HIBSY|nr:hypothetical protein F3Y22_tig00004072pilonHSYRG00349 [Hibiscus syriacus]